jgi:hypothetical protein
MHQRTPFPSLQRERILAMRQPSHYITINTRIIPWCFIARLPTSAGT